MIENIARRMEDGWLLEGFVASTPPSFKMRIVHESNGESFNASGETLTVALGALNIAAKPKPVNVTLCTHESDGARILPLKVKGGKARYYGECLHCHVLFNLDPGENEK